MKTPTSIYKTFPFSFHLLLNISKKARIELEIKDLIKSKKQMEDDDVLKNGTQLNQENKNRIWQPTPLKNSKDYLNNVDLIMKKVFWIFLLIIIE
jgi:hypothetical protein